MIYLFYLFCILFDFRTLSGYKSEIYYNNLDFGLFDFFFPNVLIMS